MSRSWRTPYDLLVRAPNALSGAEQQLKTIDPGGIEQTYGGITQAQVHMIAHLAHVAVAAPEATVGWITLHPYLPLTVSTPGMYRITTTLRTAAAPHALVRVQRLFLVLPLGRYVQVAGQESQGLVSVIPLDATGRATLMASWSLPTLLTGIDPTAEAHLVGLVWHPTQTGKNGLPLLMDTHSWTAIDAAIQVEQAALPQTAIQLSTLQEQTSAFLWQTIMHKQLDAPTLLALLASELRLADQQSGDTPLQGGGVTRYARVAFTPLEGGVPPALVVSDVGDDSNGAVVRLALLPEATTPWVALEQGRSGDFSTFDATKLPGLSGNSTTSVPLGLYSPISSTLAPELWPQHAIISWPPLLFTTIQVACALTGMQCISAVRVRVAGIGAFGPRSESLLQGVAMDIEKHTGLHVDVLTGASGQLLMIRGGTVSAAIPPFSELWIQPYAALTITRGVNGANVLLLLAVLSIAALALIAAGLLAAQSRQKDIALLADTGWTRQLLEVESALEAGVTAVLALLPTGLCVWILEKLAVPLASPFLIMSIAGLSVLLYSVVVTIGTQRMTRCQTRIRSVVRKQWTQGAWWWMLVMRQFAYRRGSAALVIVSTAGACGLVCFMLMVQMLIDGILYATLLGQQVQVNLSAVHVAIAVLTCVSALLTISLTLLLVVRERVQEFMMLLSFGWTRQAIIFEILREGVLLGLCGGFIGGCVAVLLFGACYHVWLPLMAALYIVGASIAGMVVCLFGAGYPVWGIVTQLKYVSQVGDA